MARAAPRGGRARSRPTAGAMRPPPRSGARRGNRRRSPRPPVPAHPSTVAAQSRGAVPPASRGRSAVPPRPRRATAPRRSRSRAAPWRQPARRARACRRRSSARRPRLPRANGRRGGARDRSWTDVRARRVAGGAACRWPREHHPGSAIRGALRCAGRRDQRVAGSRGDQAAGAAGAVNFRINFLRFAVSAATVEAPVGVRSRAGRRQPPAQTSPCVSAANTIRPFRAPPARDAC